MVRERPDLKQYEGRELTVIAWLWARTVKSPNPAFFRRGRAAGVLEAVTHRPVHANLCGRIETDLNYDFAASRNSGDKGGDGQDVGVESVVENRPDALSNANRSVCSSCSCAESSSSSSLPKSPSRNVWAHRRYRLTNLDPSAVNPLGQSVLR